MPPAAATAFHTVTKSRASETRRLHPAPLISGGHHSGLKRFARVRLPPPTVPHHLLPGLAGSRDGEAAMRLKAMALCAVLVVCVACEGVAGSHKEPAPLLSGSAQRCSALLVQFDAAAAAAARSVAALAAARKLRDEGERLCATKHRAVGARRIAAALSALGVQPQI